MAILLIVFSPSDAQILSIEKDSIELNEGHCLFDRAELNKVEALVLVDKGL